MLEEGNVFVERYNHLAGARVVVRYQLGVPYFFGGKAERLLLVPRAAWQDSQFFVSGRLYLYGFDCHGLTQWVYQANGWNHPEKISDIFRERGNENSRIDLMGLPFDRWREALPIGALMAIRGKSGNHIMMYAGTLRGYGYEEQAVEEALRPYLDYPLFIQSGYSPAAVSRNAAYIAGLNRPWKIYNTDGGVNVCIVGVPPQAAPRAARSGKAVIPIFELEGQELGVHDLSEKLAYWGWYPDAPPAHLREPRAANTVTIPAPVAPEAGAAAAASLPSVPVLSAEMMLPEGPVRAHPVLDSAFEMLEKDNLFVRRYNELAGRDVAPRFDSGVPYLAGGDSDRYLLMPRKAPAGDGYFKQGKVYLGGFDSIGFTKWVYGRCLWRHASSIRGILGGEKSAGLRIPLEGLGFESWRKALPIGALLAADEGGRLEVMIYIGTLEHYGLTGEVLPEGLRGYERYPLFIRCGKSPAAARRSGEYIEELARPWPIEKSNGGVHVCIAGLPREAAPPIAGVPGGELRGFDLAGQELVALEIGQGDSFCSWYPERLVQLADRKN